MNYSPQHLLVLSPFGNILHYYQSIILILLYNIFMNKLYLPTADLRQYTIYNIKTM